MAVSQDAGHALAVFDRIEQRVPDTDLCEEGRHFGRVPPERFHLGTFEQRRALHDHMGVSRGGQAEQCFARRLFVDATAFEFAQDDARSPGFPHVQLRKGFRSLGIDGIDGLGAGLVVRGPEMHQQQRGLVATLHGCGQVLSCCRKNA